MKFKNTLSSPHITASPSLTRTMLWVVVALVPGSAFYVAFFGTGLLINMALATLTALASEALMLRLRRRAVLPFITDGSALVTALLLALALPPFAPWWLPVLGTLFAIVVAKHLYGGLGYNPFNPAMVGYAMLLIAFPREMTAWLPPTSLGATTPEFLDLLNYSLFSILPADSTYDSISMATPMDTVKTRVGLGETISDIHLSSPGLFSTVSGTGWDRVNLMFLLGGMWLIYKRVVAWQIPFAMLSTLALMATVFWLIDSEQFSSPWFHLFSGAAMLGAFFIASDPVTAATTPRGRLIYGAGIGALTYIIRNWGGYPDGVAFAVLLMNMAVPTIDYYTQPRVFGEERN